MAGHFVEIVSHVGDNVVKTLGPYDSERTAERAERGVEMNLDHASFYTRIVSN